MRNAGNYQCLCCGQRAGDIDTSTGNPVVITHDHIVPLSWGGANSIENSQPLCQPCNSRKGNRHATDYRVELLEQA